MNTRLWHARQDVGGLTQAHGLGDSKREDDKSQMANRRQKESKTQST